MCYNIPMSSPTTVRLDDDLKARVAAAAERAGKTPHGFIVDAIAMAAEQSELQSDFHQVAARRLAKILATGEGITLEELRDYLHARLRGENPKKPKSRKLVR